MQALKNDSQNHLELPLLNSAFDIFNHGHQQKKMFFGHYNRIPNIITIDKIESYKMMQWLEKTKQNQIIKKHYTQAFNSEKMIIEIHETFYYLNNGIMVNITDEDVCLLFIQESEQLANHLFEQFKYFIKKPQTTTDISLIVVDRNELTTKQVFIKKPEINFNLHYNDDFIHIHEKIVEQLNKIDSKGLYLFHGLPGTGKTTYIKYLIYQLKKKVVFLSPKMAGSLDSMSMTNFLIDNRNSVLVIEDAEELITSREQTPNSSLSMILNLTDGLLGESLGIQIIATFNTDISNIDEALLRKGRLTSIYEFKPLSVDKTNNLLKFIGHRAEINKSLALADIFNFEINNNHQLKLTKAIGFRN